MSGVVTLSNRHKGNRSYGNFMNHASVLPIRELQIFAQTGGGGGGSVQRATMEAHHDRHEHVAENNETSVVPIVPPSFANKGQDLAKKGLDRGIELGRAKGRDVLQRHGIIAGDEAQAMARYGGRESPYGGMYRTGDTRGADGAEVGDSTVTREGIVSVPTSARVAEADVEAEKIAFAGEELKRFFALTRHRTAAEDLKHEESAAKGARFARGARNAMPERGVASAEEREFYRAPWRSPYFHKADVGGMSTQDAMGIRDISGSHWSAPPAQTGEVAPPIESATPAEVPEASADVAEPILDLGDLEEAAIL